MDAAQQLITSGRVEVVDRRGFCGVLVDGKPVGVVFKAAGHWRPERHAWTGLAYRRRFDAVRALLRSLPVGEDER